LGYFFFQFRAIFLAVNRLIIYKN